MAGLALVEYQDLRPEVGEKRVEWVKVERSPIGTLPQLYWGDSEVWSEANLWALSLRVDSKRSKKTVVSNMGHLLAYARWLESEGVDWWHFPDKAAERCLVRFRGALVKARDEGDLSPSTVSNRMASVIRFYRWAEVNGLISKDFPKWNERIFGIKLTDAFGLQHTLNVASTDLAIPNRKVAGALQLEDGVMPVSVSDMKEILTFAHEFGSEEIALMLRVGFGTGMRIGSITDLKLGTLDRATPHPVFGSNWFQLSIGPAARPQVDTKFGVSGFVPISTALLGDLRSYATSTRHLKRQSKADKRCKDVLFLTSAGNPYGAEDSRAINVAMSRLRERAKAEGVRSLRDFYFHRSRATFATLLMKSALKHLPVYDAIRIVREACLHRDEATTMSYVKFIEKSKAMAEAADAFSEAFMGITGERKNA